MAAQALYLKYRPRTFDEVVGQEAITRTLRNALRQERTRHAYLFTGPRGTGKTTTARLLAKAVNCLAESDNRPCNECSICRAVNDGRLLDLIEIDAASNRGIDEIRDIREKVGFRPNEARYKVYVLDEAHMLTEPAFNALLKTLEEPPPHVIFALVTTDPHKIPATISSRCQRFDFRRISIEAAVGRLAFIAGQEGLRVEPAALELIARQTTGAMRDAISLLDQLTSYGDDIGLDQVQMILGTLAGETAAGLVRALAAGDAAGGLELINQVVSDGADPRQFGREIVDYLRGLLLIKYGTGVRLLNATAEQAADMEELAARLTTWRLLEAIRLFSAAGVDLRGGLQTIPQLPLELALIQSTLDPARVETPAGKPPDPAPSAAPPARVAEARPAAPRPADGEIKTSAQADPPGAARREPSNTEGPAPAAPLYQVGRQPAAEEQPPGGQPAAQAPGPAAPAAPTASPGLSLELVQKRWPDIIAAVNAVNKTTAAVLRSNCQPIDLAEGQVIVTVPSTILREKLEDMQRKVEVQDAMSSILGGRCRLRLVLPGEYTAKPRPAASSLDDQAIDEISRWAAERGGHTTIVQS